MIRYNIQAKADVAEIDIFGTIGEDWFSEGYTMQQCRADLAGITAPEIVLNVSSLGGYVTHALTIHDIIKAHPSHVTARIMGATASAGTIVALAADTVEMSRNALFLVHNAWTMAVGNAEELREQAEHLDKFDDRLVEIYKKRTGRRDNTIRKLMAEERWIDADEAMDFGFIDKAFEPNKAAASMVKDQISQIMADGRLPKLPERITNNETMDKSEMTWFREAFEWIKAKIDPPKAEAETETEIPAEVPEVVEPQPEPIEPETEEVEEPEAEPDKEVIVAVAEAVADKELELETERTAKAEAEKKLAEAQAKLNEVSAKIEEIEGKLAVATAKTIAPVMDDPDPTMDKKVKSKFGKTAEALKEYINDFKPKN